MHEKPFTTSDLWLCLFAVGLVILGFALMLVAAR
jgi:hypothetical protein